MEIGLCSEKDSGYFKEKGRDKDENVQEKKKIVNPSCVFSINLNVEYLPFGPTNEVIQVQFSICHSDVLKDLFTLSNQLHHVSS